MLTTLRQISTGQISLQRNLSMMCTNLFLLVTDFRHSITEESVISYARTTSFTDPL